MCGGGGGGGEMCVYGGGGGMERHLPPSAVQCMFTCRTYESAIPRCTIRMQLHVCLFLFIFSVAEIMSHDSSTAVRLLFVRLLICFHDVPMLI